MRTHRIAAVVAALAIAPAAAQQASPFGSFKHDNSLPIEITSDALEVRDPEKLAVFSGDVVAGQGKLRLTSDILNVWYDGENPDDAETGAISRLRAEGDVFLSSGAETARGAWALYDVETGIVTMGGGVTLTQGENAIRGETLRVDLNAGQGRVEGGRVRSVFRPSQAETQ